MFIENIKIKTTIIAKRGQEQKGLYSKEFVWNLMKYIPAILIYRKESLIK